ncbi:50S ribosomal protein L11 methyltransferase [uncultured Helicobacter sp.]|uniref:50S ribosomal protein L11 methyltransferase n=1 Tax=uncultured Helicobacter sp. TaxID=175537 RepID=UPI00374F4381
MHHQQYFEYIIYPSQDVEVFADFLSCFISRHSQDSSLCSIEYIQDKSVFDQELDLSRWHTLHTTYDTLSRSLQQTKLIARLPYDLGEEFGAEIADFCEILTSRTESQVGCVYAIVPRDNQDWIQAYKDSIKPVVCGRFLVTPSWESLESPSSTSDDTPQACVSELTPIIIDPALAFGSGHHASTAMCIQMLDTLNLQDKRVLDVGCGSGILSIVACKLGAKVYACDTDLLSITESNKNFSRNNAPIHRIWEGSIGSLKEDLTFNVIVANILAFTLKVLYKDFVRHLNDDGILILSGILESHKDDVMETFLEGFSLIESCTRDEWVALKLQKRTS